MRRRVPASSHSNLKMKSPLPYVNDEVAKRDFKYYIFDWDDNILHMATKIRLEHRGEDGVWRPVEVSTSTYAMIRNDTEHYRAPIEGGWRAAFSNFEDLPGEDTAPSENNCFIADTIDALNRVAAGEKPGPSFTAMRRTLREGRLFAIVTARGHSPATLQRAVRLFIERVLTNEERAEMMSNLRGYRRYLDGVADGAFGTDEEELNYYLGMCRYCAVGHRDFLEQMNSDPVYNERLSLTANDAKSELAKEFAIRDFVEHIFHMLRRTGATGRAVSIGFSDDDRGNVKAVSNFIRSELAKRFADFKFVVYDTSDRTLSKGRKVCVSGQPNFPGFH